MIVGLCEINETNYKSDEHSIYVFSIYHICVSLNVDYILIAINNDIKGKKMKNR